MRTKEQISVLPGMTGRRVLTAFLLALLLTEVLAVLVGAAAGLGPSPAQGAAAGQSAPGVLAVSSPISGTFQVVLPLVYRDWQPAPPQVVYLSADPGVVAPGQSTTLSWGVNNEVFGLTLLPGGTDVTGRGSLEVWPAETTVYRLVATNALGSDSAEVTITVQPLPEITLFMANPDTIDVGGQSLLMWRVSESVTRLVLEPEVGEVTGQASATVWPTHTTVYTLTAYNAVGSTTAQVTVTVNPPTIYWFRADPATVDQGTPSTLSWSVSQPVDSLTIEPGLGEVTGLSSVQVAPAQTTVYTLTAANSAGSDTEQVTVTVRLAPVITSFTANPAAINAGESATLQWAVTGEVDSLAIDQGAGDVTGLSSKVVSPAATTTYRLTASNGAGSDTAEVTVTVSGTAPDITSFAANPATISSGGSSTLSWTVVGVVSSLAIDQGVGDVTGLANRVVQPAATTTYRLTATNVWGSDTADVTVTVSGEPPDTELLVYDWNKPVLMTHHGFPRETPPRDLANGDWTAPANLAQGKLYFRVEISSMPVVKQMQLQYCVWQDQNTLENCGPTRSLWGNPGTVVTWSVQVQDMWKKDGNPIDWTRPRETNGVAIKAMSGIPVSDYGDWNWAGENPDEWYPLGMRFTVVVVAQGEAFSGWKNYVP